MTNGLNDSWTRPAQLVDTHTHIHAAQAGLSKRDFTTKKWHEAGETDPDGMIETAKDAGVTRFICVGTDAADSRIAVDFVQNRPNCWASVGVHPHEAQNVSSEDLRKIRNLYEKEQSGPSGAKKIVAIGEVGLDYYYEHSPKELQIKLLEQFLEMASEYNLPVIFHVREAYNDFWPLVSNFEGLRGVLHSFTASQSDLDKALNLGLYIGLNGIMTFTKDDNQLTIAKSVPTDKLLLETDAPYLTPKPFRGKICKSEYVRLTAEFLAGLRGETLEQLAATTTANAQRLFNL